MKMKGTTVISKNNKNFTKYKLVRFVNKIKKLNFPYLKIMKASRNMTSLDRQFPNLKILQK